MKTSTAAIYAENVVVDESTEHIPSFSGSSQGQVKETAGHIVSMAGSHGRDATRVGRENQDVRDGRARVYTRRTKMRNTMSH